MQGPSIRFWKRYGLAVLLAAGAGGVRLLLDPVLNDKVPFLLFALAIMGSAAYGGLGPGLLCTSLSTVLASWIWIEPRWTLHISTLDDWIQVMLMIGVGAGISLISAAMLSARATTAAAIRDRDISRSMSEVLSSITDCFFSLDRQWHVTDINEKTAAYIGKSREELLGHLLWEVAPALVGAPVERHFREAMQKGLMIDLEIPSVVHPGRWLDMHLRPTPEGLRVFYRDITDRKRAEEALRISEDHLRLAAEAAGIGMWHRDVSGGEVEWTERGKVLFGLPTAAKLSFNDFLDLIHPEDRPRIREAVSHALVDSTDHRIDLEYRICRPDGSVHWIAVLGRAFSDESGRPRQTYGVMIDITARKNAEAELKQAKAAAEQASAAKDQFLAVLSHELRTPLTPVLAVAGLLEKDNRLPEDARADARMIGRNVELETRLIDDLLDLTRVSRGKLKLDKRTVELGAVLRQALEICSAEADAKDQRMALDIHGGPHYVRGDPSRLQQVYWNLLKNAIKFTPAGGNIAMRCFGDAGGRVITEVADNGIGIEAQYLPCIFDAFDQGNREVTREFGGLGLGLSISKALVEMHGGSIQASSGGKGCGATFRVELPAEAASAIRGALPAVESPGHRRTARQPANGHWEILLVEDHADTARIMSRLLQGAGHTVHVAGSVAAAMDLAQKASIDLIISDLGLPDGSGLDLMRDLRACGFSSRGIALSGFGRQEDIDRSHAVGFAEHLAKPVNFDHLCAAIDRVMGADRRMAERL